MGFHTMSYFGETPNAWLSNRIDLKLVWQQDFVRPIIGVV